jgi:predicted PolB exonuclease-like 3'-5' exonuclease
VYAPNEAGKLRVKSFYGDDEVALLAGFSDALERFASKRQYYLCAHNGKEFDFPYIARRMVINGMPLPRILDVAGRKPWEVPFLDTMELWKFGDFKHYTSLHLLTTVLNIPTPKDDIDGSMVAEVYYTLGDVRRIASYCEKDVVAVAQIMRRYKGEPLLDANDIELVP